MGLQNKREELIAAWSALEGNSLNDGWRTINVSNSGPCDVRAGRRFPGNEEALLVNFKLLPNHFLGNLPQSHGFEVLLSDLSAGDSNSKWIAICRHSTGNLDFFAMMLEDILLSIEVLKCENQEAVFELFIKRIIAWQDFMKKNQRGLLSSEEEIGLYGELEILADLIRATSSNTVNYWRGPLKSPQDFIFKKGMVEVKTSVTTNNFIAQISSLGQLDCIGKSPLYLACINLQIGPEGKTITEKISEITALLNGDNASLFIFNNCLLHTGYCLDTDDKYIRHFRRQSLRIFNVDDSFPKLTSHLVSLGITKVQYEINIDLINNKTLEFESLVNNLEY